MESSLLKASTSQFAQLALLKQKLSRAERERDMYEHASKLSFPTTTRIPSRGQVKWKTTTTENALCWALDAHGMQVRCLLGLVDMSSINTYRALLLSWTSCLMVKVLLSPNPFNLYTCVPIGMSMN